MIEKEILAVVDALVIRLEENEKAGKVLIKFYYALGWNGEDMLDPKKIRTTKAVYNGLYDLMFEKCPEPVGVGMTMVNRGPGVDDDVPEGKVQLLKGWAYPVDGESVV